MVVTRSGNGNGKGRGKGKGKGEVQRKRKLKGNKGTNYRKVEATKNQSLSLSSSDQLSSSSDSSQLSFKLSPPAQENSPFNILQYCYTRRQATPPLTDSLMRTPRRVRPQSRHFENNVEPTFDAEMDVTTPHEVPIGGDLNGNMGSQIANDNGIESVGNMASNQFEDYQGKGERRAPNSSIFHHSATTSMNITEMAELIEDESSETDSSCGSEAGMVYVEGYKVRPQYADILNTIISKFGDIGANCSLQSDFCSFSMELLCKKVLELKANTILKITKKEITDMQACICEIERQNIEVGWLKTRLDDILEAKLAVPILRHSSSVRMRRGEWKEKVRTVKEQLSIYDKEMHALQEKINATQQELSHAESEATITDLIFFESRAKLERVSRLGSLISGLL